MRLSVATLLVLVATCAAIFWAVRTAQDADLNQSTRRWLRSKSPDRRIAAIRNLGSVKAKESQGVILDLIPLVDDPDLEVREEAILALSTSVSNALGRWPWLDAGQQTALAAKTRAAINALIAAQKAREPRVRVAAAMGFSRIAPLPVSRLGGDDLALIDGALQGRRVVDALAEALGDPDINVRLQAASALRAVGVWAPVGPPAVLFQALSDDPNPEIRAAAAATLGGFRRGTKDVIPALFQAMETGNGRLVHASASSLQDVLPPPDVVPLLAEKLKSELRPVRVAAGILLAKMGPDAADAIPALIKMAGEAVDPRMQVTGTYHPREWFPSAEWDPAHVAAYALGQIAPGSKMAPQAAGALVKLLDSGLDWRRLMAAEALSRFGQEASEAVPAVVAAMRQALASDGQSESAALLARALGKLAPRTPRASEAIAVLSEALKSPAPNTRLAAALALSAFGPAAASAAPQLRLLRDDPTRGMREAAEVALKAIGQPATSRDE